MRRMLTVLFVALLGLAAPAASQQGESPPTELWKEYPLETVPSDPSSPQEQPRQEQQGGGTESPPPQEEPREPAAESAPPASDADDSGVATFALVAITLLVVLAGAGIMRLGLKARRSRTPRPRPAAAARRARPAPPRAAGANGAGDRATKEAPAVADPVPGKPELEPAAAEDERERAKPEPEPAAAEADAEPAAEEAKPVPAAAVPEREAQPEPAPAEPEPEPAAAEPEPDREPEPAAPEPEPAAAEAETEPAAPAEPAAPTPVPSPPARMPRGPRPVPGNGHHPSRPTPAIPAAARAGGQRAPARSVRQIAPEDERALGYTTVARPKDAESQLRAEARQIQQACKRRGLPLKKLVRDLESHGAADLTRPGLSFALEQLGKGDYTCLVVTSLDRLTRSAANLGTLIYLLEERRTRLIVVDIDLDTGTEEGRLAARALVKVSGLERQKLEQQTREGLDAARDKRRSSGRPAVADRPTLRRRIAEMRAGGMTLQAIADTLNEEGVPTLRGGAQWRPSSVQAAAGYKRPPRKSGAKTRKGAHGD